MMAQFMKAIGIRITLMEKEKKFLPMGPNSKAYSKMDLKRKENSPGLMDLIMMGI